jgi:predicted nuclease of restriction endonuclease-like (RecB) superfamily
MNKKLRGPSLNFDRLLSRLEATHTLLQRQAVQAVDSALATRNWLIGSHIVEYEQRGSDRARYGEHLLERLSEAMTSKELKGFSVTNLKLSRQFYQAYPEKSQALSGVFKALTESGPQQRLIQIGQTLSDQLPRVFSLSWSQYIFLLQITDSAERRFYELEAASERWSLRELRRQYDTSLYERLALSRNKKRIHALSRQGLKIDSAQDAIKDPYVLEFLRLEERTKYSESDLERAIIDRLERFLLELGKGFLFEARQKRLTLGEDHYFVDLVFYNRLLKAYVLFDLKIGKLTHQDIGQMQMYVGYFDRYVKTKNENPTIGVLLCKTKDDAMVRLTVPRSNKTIFASRYQLYLPSKAELRHQLQAAKGTTD